MRKIAPAFVLLLILAISSAFTTSNPNEQTKINWLTWEEAVEKNAENPKPIVVDVYTDWCGWCKRMDATTFSNAEVVDYTTNNFYAVKFDAEQKGDIEFQGTTFKYVQSGRRGYHELAAAILNGKMSYPTVVLFNEKFEIIQPIAGFQDAGQMERILKFIGSNAYKDTKWEAYTADDSKFVN